MRLAEEETSLTSFCAPITRGDDHPPTPMVDVALSKGASISAFATEHFELCRCGTGHQDKPTATVPCKTAGVDLQGDRFVCSIADAAERIPGDGCSVTTSLRA